MEIQKSMKTMSINNSLDRQCSLFTDRLFSIKSSPSARIKIKPSGTSTEVADRFLLALVDFSGGSWSNQEFSKLTSKSESKVLFTTKLIKLYI